jgi:hypothetical protein
MTTQELVDSVAYCGLVCAVCTHACEGCRGCRAGGGDKDCHQRQCCVAKGLAGCWECDAFPCNRGFFADPAWGGLCVGCVRVAKESGVETLVQLIASRLGERVEYGDYRFKRAEEIEAMLRGDSRG